MNPEILLNKKDNWVQKPEKKPTKPGNPPTKNPGAGKPTRGVGKGRGTRGGH